MRSYQINVEEVAAPVFLGKVSKQEVLEQLNIKPKERHVPRYTNVGGVPHKRVNGVLVPLKRVSHEQA